MNFQQKIAVGIADVVVLIELCVSLLFANMDPDNLSSIFFKYFFSMLVPTLVLATVFVRRLADTR